jgi:hypothetical protein
VFLEGLLPESGFIGHHYSVLKERLQAPLAGAWPVSSFGPAGAACTAPRRGPALSCAYSSLRTA